MTDNDEDYNKYMNISDTLMYMFSIEIQDMKINFFFKWCIGEVDNASHCKCDIHLGRTDMHLHY